MEIAFLTLRIAGYVALVFFVLSPGIAVAFLGVQLGVFGVYMGMAFAPNHKGMPLVPAEAEDRLPPTSGADESQHPGLSAPRHRDGRAELPDRAPSVPVHAPAAPSRGVAMIAEFCRDHCVSYTETGLWESYGIVIRYINRVGLG